MLTVVRGAAAVLTVDPERPGALGELTGTAIALEAGCVCWIGPERDAPEGDVVDASGCVVLPGLVDCHTHLVWAGDRSDEFRRRLAGESYTSILEGGGGILSTVRATRAAPDDVLEAVAVARLRAMRARGVTTVEAKSGYGLDPSTEARILRIARAAGSRADVRVLGTFLGAHAIPAEWRHDRAAYVRQVIDEQLPAALPWAHAIDAYVDRGAFTLEEGLEILAAGKAAGLHVRVHAEQVVHTGIAAGAAKLGAISADHLERIDEAGIAAMAAAGTVAVLLPTAMLYLRDPPPPVAALRAAGVPLAVATDYNPGTSPLSDLWLAATLAVITLGLTVEEAILAITRNAARAIGVPGLGQLRVGGPADLVVVEPAAGFPPTAAGLIQPLGGQRVRAVLR